MDKLLTVQEAAEAQSSSQLLTLKEACSFLKISSTTLYRYCRRGTVPHYKMGSQYRFRTEDLEEWILHGRHEAKLAEEILKNALTNSPLVDIDNAEGGQKVARKKTRHNYGYGSIYVRKTKKGIPRYYIEYYDKSGKRIQRVAKSATNWNEAKSTLDNAVCNVLSQETDGKNEKARITFEKFSRVYLEDYAKIRKKSWERSDKVYLSASLIPYFGRFEIRKVTQHNIEKFIGERLKSEVEKSTINRELSCLSMIFNKAIDWGYLNENPAARVKRFSEQDNMRKRILSDDEEVRLLKHSAEHLISIITMALDTGMRLGEILNLTWSKVDMITRNVHVENTKSQRNRIVKINQNLHEVLTTLKDRNGQGPYLFPNPNTGKPYTTIKTAFKGACRRANISGLRFHDLRHTHCTRVIQNSDIETVRDLMGHQSYITTQRYLHTNEERKRLAVESLTRRGKRGTEKGKICYTDCYTGIKGGKEKED